METKKNAIVLGDYHYQFHPLSGVDAELSNILMQEMNVMCTDEYNVLLSNKIKECNLLVCYVDRWKNRRSLDMVDSILTYVSGGGGLLAIHTGIFLQFDYELAQMLGAKFVTHPPYTTLDFTIKRKDHPIMMEVEDFTMEDEPFQFVLSPFTPRKILMEYMYEGKSWPAAWAQPYGMGKVVYLAPGHNAGSFSNPMFRKIVFQSAKWASSNEK